MQALAVMLAVLRKDILDFFKNRALVLSLLAPVLLSVVFIRLADRQKDRPVRLAVAAAGQTRFASRLERIRAFHVEPASDEDDARRRVQNGQVDFALVLPEDFDVQLEAEARPTIVLIARQDRGPQVSAGLSALVETLRSYAGQDPPVQVELRTVGADLRQVVRARLTGAWVLFALLVGFTVVASSLIEEKEQGTLPAVLVTRAELGSLLAGKGLAGGLLCLAATGAILLLNGMWTGWGALVVTAAGAAFVVGLGLWMGAVFPNMAAGNAGLSMIFLILFVPVFLTDMTASIPWASAWVRLLPSHTLMQGLQRVLERGPAGAGLAGTGGILAAWALVCCLGAFWTLRLQQSGRS